MDSSETREHREVVRNLSINHTNRNQQPPPQPPLQSPQYLRVLRHHHAQQALNTGHPEAQQRLNAQGIQVHNGRVPAEFRQILKASPALKAIKTQVLLPLPTVRTVTTSFPTLPRTDFTLSYTVATVPQLPALQLQALRGTRTSIHLRPILRRTRTSLQLQPNLRRTKTLVRLRPLLDNRWNK